MRRRTLLRTAPAIALAVLGCVTRLGNAEEEDSANDRERGNQPDGPAQIEIESHLDRTLTVTVDIEGDPEITRPIPAQETVSVESEITETGVHPLEVRTSEGHVREYEWDVSEWALDGKGGLVVEITHEGIRFLRLA
jgi:hypothetical protein